MILAVDGGASKTVALVYDETKLELIGLGIAGPTNLTSVPREEIVFNIQEAVTKACEQANITIKNIGNGLFGIAGIGDSPSLTRSGMEIIAKSTGRSDFMVMNDGRPAYQMANLDYDGIVFAGGTGSVAFFKHGETTERRGGWNWFAGDNSSASWIAKRGLNLATLEYDGLLDEKHLVNSVETYFANDFREVLASIEENQNKRHIAGFAPYVTKLASLGYPPAMEILDECADYVVRLIESLLPKFKKTPRISLVGGTMLAGNIYTDRIKERLNVPIDIFYGYQVAAGAILLMLKDMGVNCTFITRDSILTQMEYLLEKISKKELKRYLNMN